MSDEAQKRNKGLGRGLSALLSEARGAEGAAQERARGGSREIPVAQLRPGQFQPRRSFDEDNLDQLVDSIRDKGVLQPILVRRLADAPGFYEIIAGERRWRAAQRAQLHQIPAVIKDMSDREALEVALIENVQRQDLSAIEEAQGYRRLAQEFSYTQEQLAQGVGKSRSHIANLLRLLNLPDAVQRMIDQGLLTAGHARALIGHSDAEALAQRIVAQGLNVRQAEQLVAVGRGKTGRNGAPTAKRAGPMLDADSAALERRIGNALGLRVELLPTIGNSPGKGELRLYYSSLDQLDEIADRLLAPAATGPLDEDPLQPGDLGDAE